MRVALRLTAVATLLAVPAAATRAQAPADTLPFRPGQWGIEAGVGSATGAGALLFLSRATALTADLGLGFNKRTQELSTPNGTSADFTGQFVSARLGLRHYVPAGRGLAGLIGGGAVLGYTSNSADPGNTDLSETNVGAFVEGGASYLVTPRLALSGTYGISFTHVSGDNQQIVGPGGQVGTVSLSGWTLQTTGARLTAAIFF